MDALGLSSSGNCFVEIVAEQNGIYYIYDGSPMYNFLLTGATAWSTKSATLSLNDWNGYNTQGQYVGTLNFASATNPIEFGVIATDSSTAPVTNNFGVDNITVTINPVPEPSATASLAVGALGILIAAWRKPRRHFRLPALLRRDAAASGIIPA
jgi:hypothetical protein